MAYGNEVWLAYVGEDKIRTVLASLGIKLPGLTVDREPGSWDAFEDALRNLPYHQALRKAHLCALGLLGFMVADVQRNASPSYTAFDTPLGRREFAPFELEFSFDPDEMGEEPKHAILGVPLSGRYTPTFLDWKNVDGTLHPVVFDTEMIRNIRIAREEILVAAPFMKAAPIIVIERHY